MSTVRFDTRGSLPGGLMLLHILLSAGLLTGASQQGQSMTLRTAAGDSMNVVRMRADNAFPIPELGAVVVKEGTDLKVLSVSPPEGRRKEYAGVDLRADDLILLANGKRVKSISELSSAHNATAVGGEIRLGIQRGQEMMVVSFPKADPKDMPQMHVRIMTSGEHPSSEILPALGVTLIEKNKKVVIGDLLAMDQTAVKNLDVKAGDTIISINGRTVSSVSAFVKAYDALEVGAPVEWHTRRGGTSLSVTFTKPKPVGRVIIRREGQ